MSRPRRPLLCLVTDRRRLAGVLDRPLSEAPALLLQQIEGAVAGGVDLVQIREGDLAAGALAGLVRDAVRMAAGSATRIVVNERLDVAMACGAAGLHLRENGIPVAGARALAPGLLIGRSIHSLASVAFARSADYMIAGTVFATASKAMSVVPLGATGLAALVAAAGSTPVLAIGGVSAEQLGAVVGAGASGVAAIGAFLPPAASDDVISSVQKKVNHLRFAFDSASVDS